MYSDDALTNHEINDIMENEPGYIATICIDQIDDIVDIVKKKNLQHFCFITNTLTNEDFEEDEDICGHWIAVWVDR